VERVSCAIRRRSPDVPEIGQTDMPIPISIYADFMTLNMPGLMCRIGCVIGTERET